MSAMSSQKRKIAIKHKDRMAAIRTAFKPEEYMKHYVHCKAIARSINEETAEAEHRRLLLSIS